jgi:hypothetical protein
MMEKIASNVSAVISDFRTNVQTNRFCIVVPLPSKLFQEMTYKLSFFEKAPPSP